MGLRGCRFYSNCFCLLYLFWFKDIDIIGTIVTEWLIRGMVFLNNSYYHLYNLRKYVIIGNYTLLYLSGLVAKSCLTVATPWTVVHRTPLYIGFSRQEYWSGQPFPSPGHLPKPGIEPGSPALQADSLLTELWGKYFKAEK